MWSPSYPSLGPSAALLGIDLAALAAERSAHTEAVTDDMREEDIEEETGIIRVQLGYVMQRQGREKEAATIYNQVKSSLPLRLISSVLAGAEEQAQ